jgi:hypothetical protein
MLMAIFMFGTAQLGKVLVRLLDLKEILVLWDQQVPQALIQLLLDQRVHKVIPVLKE